MRSKAALRLQYDGMADTLEGDADTKAAFAMKKVCFHQGEIVLASPLYPFDMDLWFSCFLIDWSIIYCLLSLGMLVSCLLSPVFGLLRF